MAHLNFKSTIAKISVALTAVFTFTACGEKDPSFSLLPERDAFDQSVSSFNNKLDILWLVDGSGTMENHQDNLAGNFEGFINDFINKGFDFHMAIASTDAWKREDNYNTRVCGTWPNPSGDPDKRYYSSADCKLTKATYAELTHFRDGDIYGAENGTAGVRSGTYLITSKMSPVDILNTFSINVRTGVRGDGTKESGFQSLRAVLRRNEDGSVGYDGETHTDLDEFRRPDAFFAVIIVTDEEDQSERMDNSKYNTVDDYVSEFLTFMDGYTGGSPGNRRYSVSTIVVDDIDNCAYGLHEQATQAYKYIGIAEATDGVVGNICQPDFSQDLTNISERIVTLSTRFRLSREPIPETILVIVDDKVVPNDESNGWAYVVDGEFHYVEFRGSAIPAQGSSIFVDFDPVTIKQ